ncbi:MAG: Major Facilitator Superfamily protein [Candidatus Methanofastidiosum methylothiophilum]|uniref:Major Facilitator Superfamily protein n=1 Tax=Candidatus Methanofastidiosum methylothiophilum TaxID=1705564 RepID=A0A150INZ9_9EURY|nr:MAG: Major Facilitator Superfamily protein [Candidatus Methanofastidiosum methylthiophilus]KYC46703.1 MAG: Major Facilitator Superfamily protein [Candidatus Methanofastidiosum methylthiophilus]
MIITLFIAYKLSKNKTGLEIQSIYSPEQKNFSKIFWLYLSFTFLATLGFASFILIGYHIKVQNLLSDTYIPLIYAFAMLMDALFAIVVGKFYDILKVHKKNEKGGLTILAIIPILSAIIPLLVFSHSIRLIFLGILIWGIVMGAHETIMRAAIADLTAKSKRGTAYGIFNTSYGLAMFVGSVTIGFLYDYSLSLLFVIVILVEILAIFLFYNIRKEIE